VAFSSHHATQLDSDSDALGNHDGGRLRCRGIDVNGHADTDRNADTRVDPNPHTDTNRRTDADTRTDAGSDALSSRREHRGAVARDQRRIHDRMP
jgi:hypothetical protein